MHQVKVSASVKCRRREVFVTCHTFNCGTLFELERLFAEQGRSLSQGTLALVCCMSHLPEYLLVNYNIYTNSFVTFLSWIYWLGTHAFNAAGHMGALRRYNLSRGAELRCDCVVLGGSRRQG